MKQPWHLNPDGELVEVHLDMPHFRPGDWPAVESWFGTPLPTDYKDLLGDGGTLLFGEELFIASPFEPPDLPTEWRNLLGPRIASESTHMAQMRQDFEEFATPIFPEPGGILWWGGDGNGGSYFWVTSSSDPDRWTVMVGGRQVDESPGEYHDCGLTTYLARLASGEVESATYEPEDWPPANPQFRAV